jgi:hypothetical protein
MSWLKLDDRFWSHPKVIRAGAEATALFVRALARAGERLTDGRVARSELPMLNTYDQPTSTGAEALAERLVDAGMFERSGSDYRIHDYLDYNPSAEEAAASRQQKLDAARRGGSVRAATGQRSPSGRYEAGDTAEPAERVDSGPPAAPAERLTSSPGRTRSRPRSRGRTTKKYVPSKATAATKAAVASTGWETFGPEWSGFKGSWVARGFRLPPSERQREVLWDVISSRPQDAGRWAAAAPAGSRERDVVGHVLKAWRVFKDDVNRSLPGDAAPTLVRGTSSMTRIDGLLRGPDQAPG